MLELFYLLSITGPKAGEVLAKLIGEEAVRSWRFLDARQVSIAGQSVHAIRISYTGELGWELYIPRQSATSVYEGVHQFGLPKMLNGALTCNDRHVGGNLDSHLLKTKAQGAN